MAWAMKIPKYLKRAHKESTCEGWTWTFKQGSQHVIVRDAEGEYVTSVSLTAYDGILTRRIESALRRAGCPGVSER